MNGVLSTTILLISFLGLQGQKEIPALQKNVRINEKKPSVYITLERVGQLKSPDPGDEDERVWLRLRNNTRWRVMLNMSSVPSAEYGDAELFYDRLLKSEVIARTKCHVCTLNSLGPGRSLVFSIPSADLAKDGAIRIKFSYGWEDQDDVTGGREVEHHVYFYGSQLPKSLLQADQ